MQHTTNTYFNLLASFILVFSLSCSSSGEKTNGGQASNTEQQAPAVAAVTGPPQQSQDIQTNPEPNGAIPEFTFYILQSGIRFERSDLPSEGNNVFIFFDPSCHHCQYEARDLGLNYDRVKGVNLYFVSMQDPALMNTFLDTYAKPLKDKPNVTLLYDRNAEFINKFHIPSQFPATYVYGADGLLKQYWNGEKDVEEIITAINQV